MLEQNVKKVSLDFDSDLDPAFGLDPHRMNTGPKQQADAVPGPQYCNKKYGTFLLAVKRMSS
jgi:hypothetical protein